MSARKMAIGLIISIATVLGYSGTSWSAVGRGGIPNDETPRVYVYQPDGSTKVYEAKQVTPVQLCAVPMRDCHDGPVGTAFYGYEQHLGRTPDSGGLQFWAAKNLSADKLAQSFLASPEARKLMGTDNYRFAGTMFVRAFGGSCYGSYCYGSTDQVNEAIGNAAQDLTYGRVQRVELGANLARFTQALGTQTYSFQEYIGELARGYDLGQLTLIEIIPPYNPCDPSGYTDDPDDDCPMK